MKIKRGISINGNLDTHLFDVVSNIPDNILFYNEHDNLRHPLGIYNISTTRVLNAFEELAILLNTVKPSLEELQKKHQELLDSLMAFIDDGYLIMKTIFPKALVNKEIRFADSWLKKIDKSSIEKFQAHLNPFREERLALIVNKVKHNHARYCHVQSATIFGKIRGYYIEGVTENSHIIPNSDIHKKYKNLWTAISFNYDIKNYFVEFYIISELIANTMVDLISIHNDTQLSLVNNKCARDPKILTICREIAKVPNLFFPDEYEKEIPQIIFDEENAIIELIKPADKKFKRQLRRYSNAKISTVMNGDGVTKTWALPYLT
jgi:hypothetical protein